jgi:uncharacterized protein YcbK (DUF882 family)
LVLYSVNKGERLRIFPFLPEGALDPKAAADIMEVLRDKNTNTVHTVNPRLIKLVYRLADHFKARQLNVISGFREATEQNESNHTRGMAIDFMIPGIDLAVLARKARQLGHVGVGLYPTSGFIHLDVRDGPSFFWIDRAGPGVSSCLHRVLPKTAVKWDRRWRPEHDEPTRHRDRKGELLGASPKPEDLAAKQDEETKQNHSK